MHILNLDIDIYSERLRDFYLRSFLIKLLGTLVQAKKNIHKCKEYIEILHTIERP